MPLREHLRAMLLLTDDIVHQWTRMAFEGVSSVVSGHQNLTLNGSLQPKATNYQVKFRIAKMDDQHRKSLELGMNAVVGMCSQNAVHLILAVWSRCLLSWLSAGVWVRGTRKPRGLGMH